MPDQTPPAGKRDSLESGGSRPGTSRTSTLACRLVILPQYTPREYRHEEALQEKGAVDILGLDRAGCRLPPIFGRPLLPWVAEEAVRLTAVGAALFVAVNLEYATYLGRAYVSFRRSAAYGDPMNDADLLTARVISWASALLAIRDFAGSGKPGAGARRWQ